MGTFSDTFLMAIKILFYPDVLPWQRVVFQSAVRLLERETQVSIEEWHPNSVKSLPKETISHLWVITSSWRSFCRTDFKKISANKIWVSVLNLGETGGSLFSLFWNKLAPLLPKKVSLVAHSDINFRFLKEILKVEESQLQFLPLPFEDYSLNASSDSVPQKGVVGTFVPFSQDSNLNFLVNVAHYVVQKRHTQFRILGSGPQYAHIARTVRELDLEKWVSVSETVNPTDFNAIDVFLYCPTRNDHFIPLLLASHFKKPILSSELPGIKNYIEEGKSGFLVSPFDTRSMGELTLRLLDHPLLSRSLASQLFQNLSERFSFENLRESYLKCFGLESTSQITPTRRVVG
jgi:glycosyltransferase involved in cell wall biosynthesis